MKSSKGFTLIELIVVMAVFLLIIGAAIGIFLSIIQRQRMILSEQELLNQTSYAEEYMSKALRMAEKDTFGNCLVDKQGNTYPGYIYLLTRPVDGFYTGIKFMNASDGDACQEFYFDTTAGILKELKNSANDGDAVALTSKDLQIQSIKFSIDGGSGCYGSDNCPVGASDTDSAQPRVTILIGIKISGDDQEPERIIQTTVSQRNLNR